MLADVSAQKAKLLELAKSHKSIAVVSHSENIKRYVGRKIKNCEVYHLKVEDLEKLDFESGKEGFWS